MTDFHGQPEIEDTAAEYVLGTLSHDERIAADVLRQSTPALNQAIEAWEQRFAPLIQDTPEAIPDPDLFARIERSLSGIKMSPSRPNQIKGKASQTNFWRPLAIAASLAFIFTLSFSLLNRSQEHIDHIAVLQQNASLPVFIASLNEQKTILSLHALADSKPPADKNYELWLITNAAPVPRSLGVLSSQKVAQVKLPKIDPASLQNATLAISVEPVGGSPTGSPTGPVVFAGKLVEIGGPGRI